MKTRFAELLNRYENGKLSRRELIAGLVMVAATAATSEAAGLKSVNIDHVSLQVSDLKRSQDFYRNILGLTLRTEPRADGSVRLDLPQSGFFVLRKGNPAGTIDHLAIKLEGFNKDSVTQQLKASGITAIDASGGAGFHIVDPDRFNIQLS